MKLLIAGSRGITEFDLSPYVSDDVDTVITGGARGIDELAEKYADERRLSKIVLRPRYALFGRAAPLIRNKEMLELSDAVLIVWDGKSRGTEYTMKLAKASGKPLTVVIHS